MVLQSFEKFASESYYQTLIHIFHLHFWLDKGISLLASQAVNKNKLMPL